METDMEEPAVSAEEKEQVIQLFNLVLKREMCHVIKNLSMSLDRTVIVVLNRFPLSKFHSVLRSFVGMSLQQTLAVLLWVSPSPYLFAK